MNPKIKKTLRILLLTALLLCVLYFVNAFTGNPISNALAKKAAQQHIDTTYPTLGLQIEKCSYNFKFSNYDVFVQSVDSRDTAFTIAVGHFGNVLRDDYAFRVAIPYTTHDRLYGELREIATTLFRERLPYDFDYTNLTFPDNIDTTQLQLDMVLDVYNPPFPLTADVVLFSEALSYTKIAEVATALDEVLRAESIPVVGYSIRLIPLASKPEKESDAFSWAGSLAVAGFPADRVREPNLPQAIEKFRKTGIATLE